MQIFSEDRNSKSQVSMDNMHTYFERSAALSQELADLEHRELKRQNKVLKHHLESACSEIEQLKCELRLKQSMRVAEEANQKSIFDHEKFEDFDRVVSKIQSRKSDVDLLADS